MSMMMKGASVSSRSAGSSGSRLNAAMTGQRSSRPMRRAVTVEANLFARIARLTKSTVTNLVNQAEDPEKLLDQVVDEMQEDLIKMRQAAAQVLASQKQLEAKFKVAQGNADEWLRKAELAVQKGEDELAKEALKRRKAAQDQANGLETQLDAQKKAVDQLVANTKVLEGKLAEAKSKKETLKARAASAKTSKQIQEMMGSLNTSNSVVAFDKMEEKVMAMEAEAESTALLVGGDKLEDKFALLEGSTVDDELAALKKGALKKDKPALPPGQPPKDAFDFELEELRRKARE